jgi:GDPmannose 4,6-dehydratase
MPEDNQQKTALITGITGQDGAYLSNLLLHKGYNVHGLRRRSSLPNTDRLHAQLDRGLNLHNGEMTDAGNIIRLINEIQPDEIYNLAAQSHVHVSFDTPEYTANADGLGTLRMLEAIRILGMEKKTRFFQASTSELFGKVKSSPQNEDTPFYPRSPYAVAKLYAYWTAVNYREAYGIYAVNGILFNHESPLRGEEFVTRKITLTAAKIARGFDDCLCLGNLDAKRDWSHAQDMMDGVWAMLQQPAANDYVLASGVAHSVREFTTLVFAELGITIEWSGSGADEVGRDQVSGKIIVQVDAQYLRPTDVDELVGDATRAKTLLNWAPKISFQDLIKEMVQMDIRRLEP